MSQLFKNYNMACICPRKITNDKKDCIDWEKGVKNSLCSRNKTFYLICIKTLFHCFKKYFLGCRHSFIINLALLLKEEENMNSIQTLIGETAMWRNNFYLFLWKL